MNKLSDPEVRRFVWQKTDGKCWYCGRQTLVFSLNVGRKGAANQFSIDHVMPRCLGGANDLDNLVPVCRSCNGAKRGKTLEQFREMLKWQEIGRFSETQIEWLQSHGIELPEPPKVMFYFELVGTPRHG
jgi:5-methylcytosine-specific restriction endonuclease McrA